MAKNTMAPAAGNADFLALKSASSTYGREARQLIKAGFQAMLTITNEPQRAAAILRELASEMKYLFVTWDINQGFMADVAIDQHKHSNPFKDSDKQDKQSRYIDPVSALAAIENFPNILEKAHCPKDAIIVMYNVQPYFENPAFRMQFQRLVDEKLIASTLARYPIFFLQPETKIKPEVKSMIRLIDLPLPTLTELRGIVEFVRTSIKDPPALEPELGELLVNSLKGLSSNDAEDTVSLGLEKCDMQFKPEMMEVVEAQKALMVGKSDVLTYVPASDIEPLELVQGFDKYLDFVKTKASAFKKEARALNLTMPKGVILIGVPGSGKSLVARITAKLLQLPLYRVDVGAIFGSLVGESEARLRQVIKTIEAQNGCVVLIDEADKVLGGISTDGRSGDNGVSNRVFGSLLSWLQDKKDPSFVLITMNRTAGIPPEFFRTGRFDAIFGVLEPDDITRRRIIEAHFRSQKTNMEKLDLDEEDWEKLIEESSGLVGSDLEVVVSHSRLQAFERRGVEGGAIPTLDELLDCVKQVRKQSSSELDKVSIEQIRTFVTDRTRPVYDAPRQRKAIVARQRTRGVGSDN